jgi:chaperone required for assembly of F1-ATPase
MVNIWLLCILMRRILIGLERAIHFSKSLIIALALSRGQLSAEDASRAALVEVQSQIDRWGEVEDSMLSPTSADLH